MKANVKNPNLPANSLPPPLEKKLWPSNAVLFFCLSFQHCYSILWHFTAQVLWFQNFQLLGWVQNQAILVVTDWNFEMKQQMSSSFCPNSECNAWRETLWPKNYFPKILLRRGWEIKQTVWWQVDSEIKCISLVKWTAGLPSLLLVLMHRSLNFIPEANHGTLSVEKPVLSSYTQVACCS